MNTASRTHLNVARAVWKALFLREATARLATGRGAALWVLIEPAAHIVFLTALLAFIRQKVIAGADTAMFVLIGVVGFFLVRNTARRGMEAINANGALLSYRQIRPVDTVLVRAVVEAFTYLLVFALLLFGCALLDIDVLPADPLGVLEAMALLWALGIGLALTFAVAVTLSEGIARTLKLAFTPLYFVSGVMYPADSVPQPVREWMMLNPIPHGLETMRAAYFPRYHSVPEANLGYLAYVALTTIFIGLALQTRFAQRLAAK